MSSDENTPNYIQQIFYAVFIKHLPSWSDVVEFSKREGININTLRDVYYKQGQAGISTMDRVLKALLNLSPEKVASITDQINSVEPLALSQQVFNSIRTSEEKRLYYAHVAKAVWEIDERLNSKKS